MRIKDGALEGLGEHVSMVLLGVLVFHNDFPYLAAAATFHWNFVTAYYPLHTT